MELHRLVADGEPRRDRSCSTILPPAIRAPAPRAVSAVRRRSSSAADGVPAGPQDGVEVDVRRVRRCNVVAHSPTISSDGPTRAQLRALRVGADEHHAHSVRRALRHRHARARLAVPPRRRRSGTLRPTRSPSSRSSRSSGDSTGWPSKSTMTSPTRSPPPRRTAARHADDQQRVLAAVAALERAAAIRQLHGLTRDAQVPALQAAVLDHRRGRLPCDRRRNDDAEAANRRRRRDADQAAGRIQKRAAREAVVHRRRRADHFVDRASASRRQRSADHRHDAGARGQRVAPRARDGEREVADARARFRERRTASGRVSRRAGRRGSSSGPIRRAPRRASRPSGRRTRNPSSRPSARAVVSTTSSAYTRPLAGRRRPWTCTTEAAAAATASASWFENVVSVDSVVMGHLADAAPSTSPEWADCVRSPRQARAGAPPLGTGRRRGPPKWAGISESIPRDPLERLGSHRCQARAWHRGAGTRCVKSYVPSNATLRNSDCQRFTMVRALLRSLP